MRRHTTNVTALWFDFALSCTKRSSEARADFQMTGDAGDKPILGASASLEPPSGRTRRPPPPFPDRHRGTVARIFSLAISGMIVPPFVEGAVCRSSRPDGFARQLIAIQTAPSRVRKLRSTGFVRATAGRLRWAQQAQTQAAIRPRGRSTRPRRRSAFVCKPGG